MKINVYKTIVRSAMLCCEHTVVAFSQQQEADSSGRFDTADVLNEKHHGVLG